MYQIKRKSLKERLERGGYQTGEINADSAGISFAFEKRDKEATIQRERERERERGPQSYKVVIQDERLIGGRHEEHGRDLRRVNGQVGTFELVVSGIVTHLVSPPDAQIP
jgi:hypothetical protein